MRTSDVSAFVIAHTRDDDLHEKRSERKYVRLKVRKDIISPRPPFVAR